MTRRGSCEITWSWTEDVLPFVTMFIVICLDMSIMTTVKAAMNGGLAGIVYVVYHNALATALLFPFFIFHILRNVERPLITFHVLVRLFILGLLGLSLFQVSVYAGISYSSPTMASAIGNLAPAFTFLLAVVFRMEKIELRSSRSVAELLGTIIAISGAMVFTFYQGPEIFRMITSPDSSNQLLLSQPSNWVIGSLIILLSQIAASLWNVLHSATAREFPDQLTIVFFFCFFGTLQCIALSFVLERNPSAWVLHPGLDMITILYGGVGSVFRIIAVTWCLEKKGPVFVAMFSPLAIVVSVIMGVTFLDESLFLGSVIGGVIIVAGFYAAMWGQAKEKNKLLVVSQDDLDVVDEHGSSDQNNPLLL